MNSSRLRVIRQSYFLPRQSRSFIWLTPMTAPSPLYRLQWQFAQFDNLRGVTWYAKNSGIQFRGNCCPYASNIQLTEECLFTLLLLLSRSTGRTAVQIAPIKYLFGMVKLIKLLRWNSPKKWKSFYQCTSMIMLNNLSVAKEKWEIQTKWITKVAMCNRMVTSFSVCDSSVYLQETELRRYSHEENRK